MAYHIWKAGRHPSSHQATQTWGSAMSGEEVSFLWGYFWPFCGPVLAPHSQAPSCSGMDPLALGLTPQ